MMRATSFVLPLTNTHTAHALGHESWTWSGCGRRPMCAFVVVAFLVRAVCRVVLSFCVFLATDPLCGFVVVQPEWALDPAQAK